MANFCPLEIPGILVYADRHKALFKPDDLIINMENIHETFPKVTKVYFDRGRLHNKVYRSSMQGMVATYRDSNKVLWLHTPDNVVKVFSGITALEFQNILESVNGSILAPITKTKDSYVYLPGQLNREGELVT